MVVLLIPWLKNDRIIFYRFIAGTVKSGGTRAVWATFDSPRSPDAV